MKMKRDYDDCLETMYGLRRFGIKLGLSTIGGILNGLGNPQDGYATIHIAGTNGKGSIAAALSAILMKAGYRVGVFTSPHLVRFNERICIDGEPIADDDVVGAYQRIQSQNRAGREPTFFEFSTAMALYEFGRRRVDWAVVETGMGGRLDATNMVRPKACVISNISVEHREYLGNTIAAIAAEKGGIIKPGTSVVTGVTQKAATDVLRAIAREKAAPFYRRGESFRFRKTADGSFNYYGIRHVWKGLRSGLSGDHQVENAALAVAVCEVLNGSGSAEIDPVSIKNGLKQTHWPGRLEIVSRRPLVILDGAHNLNAARVLATYLKTRLAGREITMVAGILDDKPYAAMLKTLLPHCSRVILTRPRISRALAPEVLREVAADIVDRIDIVPDVGQAVAQAIRQTADRNAVCIAGSLYVVGEAKEALESNPAIGSRIFSTEEA